MYNHCKVSDFPTPRVRKTTSKTEEEKKNPKTVEKTTIHTVSTGVPYHFDLCSFTPQHQLILEALSVFNRKYKIMLSELMVGKK